jgi:glycerol-3-phosphate responsive antiterminator
MFFVVKYIQKNKKTHIQSQKDYIFVLNITILELEKKVNNINAMKQKQYIF